MTFDTFLLCRHCGCWHSAGACWRIKSIEYHPDGSVKRVEYHDPAPTQQAFPPVFKATDFQLG